MVECPLSAEELQSSRDCLLLDGFGEYFIALSPDVREELIARTRL